MRDGQVADGDDRGGRREKRGPPRGSQQREQHGERAKRRVDGETSSERDERASSRWREQRGHPRWRGQPGQDERRYRGGARRRERERYQDRGQPATPGPGTRAGSRSPRVDAEADEAGPREGHDDHRLDRVAQHAQGRDERDREIVEGGVAPERHEQRAEANRRERPSPAAAGERKRRADEREARQTQVERGQERLTAFGELLTPVRGEGQASGHAGQESLGQAGRMHRPVRPHLLGQGVS